MKERDLFRKRALIRPGFLFRLCISLVLFFLSAQTVFAGKVKITEVNKGDYTIHYSGNNFHEGLYFFKVHNKTISVDKPYVEFSYIYRSSNVGRDDTFCDILIEVCINGGWTKVGSIEKERYDMKRFNAAYGALEMKGIEYDGKHYNFAKVRFFPGEKSLKLGENITHLRVKGIIDWQNDGSGASTYISYTMPVNVNFSRPSGKIARSNYGKMNFEVTDVPKVNTFINSYELGTQYSPSRYASRELSGNATNLKFEFQKGSSLFQNNITEEVYVRGICSRYLSIGNGSEGSTKEDSIKIKQRFVTKPVIYNMYGFVKPQSIQATPDQWNKSVNLVWEEEKPNRALTNGKWYIFRAPNTSLHSRELITEGGLNYSRRSFTDNHESLVYDKAYTYTVSFIPDNWSVNAPVSDLSTNKETIIQREFNVDLHTKSTDNSIDLSWNHKELKEKNAQFKIFRKDGLDGVFRCIHTISNIPSSSTKQTYSDKGTGGFNLQSCKSYSYYIQTLAMGTEFKSKESLEVKLSGNTEVTSLKASKGTFSNSVKLNWKVKQVGSLGAVFILSRKSINGSDDFKEIYRTTGVLDSYLYEDNLAVPGQYYRYQLTALVKCDNQGSPISNSITDVGFSQNTGVISGRVSYGTGTTVPNVTVNLIRKEDDPGFSQFHSLRVDGLGGGAFWDFDKNKGTSLFVNKPFTFQLWVNPNENIKTLANKGSKPIVLDAFNAFSIILDQYKDNQYRLCAHIGDGSSVETYTTTLRISANRFTNVGVKTDGKGNWTIFMIDDDKNYKEFKIKSTSVKDWSTAYKSTGISIGTNISNIDDHVYKGYIDDVRLWNRELSKDDICKNTHKILHGGENGLILYWPMDEGIGSYFFDISKTSGIANENHSRESSLYVISSHVPLKDQLSLYGMTDLDGNYTIRGVPFSGSGSTYSVVPSYGIHEFSPKIESRFINSSSLTHNGVNFNDISSFPVTGSVYYENTLYPVKGANLYVDGTICSKNGKVIETNAEGKFEISVPIGDHYIEIRKQGHTFKGEGRYPVDPENVETRITFDKPMNNLTFYDNTKIAITGRVCGGNIERNKPLGFGKSKANIGKAKIILSTGYPMNVIEKKDGTSIGTELNPEKLTYEAASKYVYSDVYAGALTPDSVKLITILTDSQTGEFAANVPPVPYEVVSVKILSNDEVKFDKGQFGLLDGSNPMILKTDSVLKNDEYEYFKYHASFQATYFAKPSFIVSDQSNEVNAFGEQKYELESLDIKEELDLYTVGEDGNVNYLFDYPVFIQMGKYSLKMEGYEEYVNNDEAGKPVTDKVPLQNSVVTITNQLSASQQVYVEGADDGEFHGELKENQLQLDSTGVAIYEFMAGFPNIVEPFTRGLNISYDHNGKQEVWDGNTTFKAIILGALPSGSNFVTAGPDKVLMILRDPGGSNSSAFMEKGTRITQVEQDGGSFITQNEVMTTTKLGVQANTINGTPGFGVIMEAKANIDLEVGANINYGYSGYKEWEHTITTTERIATSDDPDYVGAIGDVFIGTSTNILFGNSRNVTITKSNGVPAISKVDALSTSSQFTTGFKYTQYYIENVLIPNLEKLRNSLITKVDNTNDITNNKDYPIYVSTLDYEDERFGSDNFDGDVWGDKAVGKDIQCGPSYKIIMPDKKDTDSKVFHDDSVRWCNSQIKLWENTLADNEEQKVKAIKGKEKWLDQNHSFDAGVIIESSTQTCDAETTNNAHEFETLVIAGLSSGTTLNGTGVAMTARTTTGGKYFGSDSNTDETCVTAGYLLKESGFNDALTMDVYKAPDGFGPIFRTRGGQTSCPYEGQEVTKYYQPGFEISTATMQIEVPEITVENSFITAVPSGKSANFEIKLRNLSETDDDIWFDLALNDETNETGVILKMDGQVITDGRAILVPAGKTLTKSLQLLQSDPGILDYRDIELVLKSQCQGDPTGTRPNIADTVKLSAQFIPSCSDVTLIIDDRIMNIRTGSQLNIKVKDYEMGYKNFKGLRLQYKGERDIDWKLMQEYVVNPSDLTDNNLLLEGGTTQFNFDMGITALYPDMTYKFRAITLCAFGNEIINNESETIEVIKDMRLPNIMGKPSPSNGILTSENEISLTLNEVIKSAELTDKSNFSVRGILNGYKVAHSVAVKLQGGEAAYTEAEFDFSNKDFSIDLWLNYSSDGSVIAHGGKTGQWKVRVNAQDQLVLNINDEEYVSTNIIPKNKWVFVSMSYDQQAENALFTATVSYDSFSKVLFDAKSVAKYEGKGRLLFGEKMTGAIHEITLWNRVRSFAEAQEKMYTSKNPSTPNLIGYWRMDEGNGLRVKDLARNRHITLPSVSSWYLENKNLALDLNGSSYVALNISKSPVLPDEDYVLEFWFRGKSQEKDAVLFSVDDSLLNVSVSPQGEMKLMAKGVEHIITGKNKMDENWHHFAFNVMRDGSSIVYIDGEVAKQLMSVDIPSLAADRLILGASRFKDNISGEYNYRNFFKGGIDEVRIWNARLTAEIIRSNQFNRLSGNEEGLIAYYPFEEKALDSGNQVATIASKKDWSERKAGDAESNGTISIIDQAPGLKEVMTMTNVNFSFVASDTKIIIDVNEDPDIIEGCTLYFTVKDVRDLNGNLSQPVTWSAFVNANQLTWSEESVSVKKQVEDELTFNVSIQNLSSETENWAFVNLPSWLNVTVDGGQLKPLSEKRIVFTVDPSTAIGKYEETIYLTGNNKIHEPLTISLAVTGVQPDWTVDPSEYEYSMNITGQIQIIGTPSQDSDDLIAAFVDDKCIGVASPVYIERYDSYYALMDVYGNAAVFNKPVSFRLWDAGTGNIYPSVSVSKEIIFADNKLEGTFSNPVIWNARDMIEQSVSLTKGWNWTSVFVHNNESMQITDLFENIKGTTEIVKSKSAFAVPSESGWEGNLKDVNVGAMYKIKSMQSATLKATGKPVNLSQTPVTIRNNWNWIGYNASYVISLNDAFASLNPENGDVVKAHQGFAVYNGFEWIGSLKMITPGKGYLYQSLSQNDKQLIYPSSNILGASMLKSQERTMSDSHMIFSPVPENSYSGNMTMITVVKDKGVVIDNAEIGVFAGNECRASNIAAENGLTFLTIAGEGIGSDLSFKVVVNGEVIECGEKLQYVDDAMIGSLNNPYVLDINPLGSDMTNQSIKVYPTLVKDYTEVYTSGHNIESISVVDVNGITLDVQSNPQDKVRLNMNSYTQGVYLIIIKSTKGEQSIFRVTKLR